MESNEPEKKSKFLDPKANLKGFSQMILILIVLGALGYLVISTYFGRDTADRMVASLTKNDIILKDSDESIPAGSYLGLSLQLPYSGNLKIRVSSYDDQTFSTYLVAEKDYANFKESAEKLFGGEFSHFQDFEESKEKLISCFGTLPKGNYYLIISNDQLGILSESSITVSVHVELSN